MSALSHVVAPGRWRRFWMIVAIFAAVPPLVTAAVVVAVARWFVGYDLAWVAMAFGFFWVFTLPLALVSGALFGALAVFRGHARLWIALAPAILMPAPVNVALGARWTYANPVDTTAVLVLFMLPLLLAWFLSRPWHR